MHTLNLAHSRIRPSAGRSSYSDSPAHLVLTVWLDVTAPSRPDNLALYLDELAWPDFCVDGCRESVCLDNDRSGRYYGQWYCRFIRMNGKAGTDKKLRERLSAPGIRILRFDDGA